MSASTAALVSEGTTTSTEPQHGDGDLNLGGEHDLAIHLDSGGALTVLMLTNRSTECLNEVTLPE